MYFNDRLTKFDGVDWIFDQYVLILISTTHAPLVKGYFISTISIGSHRLTDIYEVTLIDPDTAADCVEYADILVLTKAGLFML